MRTACIAVAVSAIWLSLMSAVLSGLRVVFLFR